MNLNHLFASNVKRVRLEQGISQETLAAKAGLHRTYISLIERDKRNISLINVEKIAQALNVPAFVLLQDLSNND